MKIIAWSVVLVLPLPVDILVRIPQEVERALDKGDLHRSGRHSGQGARMSNENDPSAWIERAKVSEGDALRP